LFEEIFMRVVLFKDIIRRVMFEEIQKRSFVLGDNQ